jgi:hypothetical protein
MVVSGGARRQPAAPRGRPKRHARRSTSGCSSPHRNALADNRLDQAEQLLRRHLAAEPDDAAALLLLASVPAKLGLLEEQGCERPDAVFIVGMPRAGSTLVEQILASHPAVEGTSELPYIPALAQRLAAEVAAYPEPPPSLR